MVRSAAITALLWASVASADPHADMAAALAAQADLRPAPATLPVAQPNTKTARGAAQTAANVAQAKAHGQANAAAHQAQAAANAAAAQQRDNDAKGHHEHPIHPTHPTHPTH